MLRRTIYNFTAANLEKACKECYSVAAEQVFDIYLFEDVVGLICEKLEKYYDTKLGESRRNLGFATFNQTAKKLVQMDWETVTEFPLIRTKIGDWIHEDNWGLILYTVNTALIYESLIEVLKDLGITPSKYER